MTTELKPCPFCGNEKPTPCKDDFDWWIECERCDSRGAYAKEASGAAKAWNTRPQPIVTTDGLVETLNDLEAENDYRTERAKTDRELGFAGGVAFALRKIRALSTTHPLNADEEGKAQ